MIAMRIFKRGSSNPYVYKMLPMITFRMRMCFSFKRLYVSIVTGYLRLKMIPTQYIDTI